MSLAQLDVELEHLEKIKKKALEMFKASSIKEFLECQQELKTLLEV